MQAEYRYRDLMSLLCHVIFLLFNVGVLINRKRHFNCQIIKYTVLNCQSENFPTTAIAVHPTSSLNFVGHF